MLVMAVGSREGGRVEGTERKGGWLFHIDSSVPFDFFFFFLHHVLLFPKQKVNRCFKCKFKILWQPRFILPLCISFSVLLWEKCGIFFPLSIFGSFLSFRK